MSGIKTINSANPGLKRPFRLSDLQNVWDGLTEALASETLNRSTPIKIVSGLHVIGGELSPGVIAYNGKLYYYEGGTDENGGFSEGNDMYVATIDGGDRTLSTGLVQPFDFSNVIRNSKVNDGAVLIITNVTENKLSKYRYVPNVNGSAIEDGTINTEKLVNMSVTSDKISDAAVTTDKIASGAVDNLQIADAAIDENKLDVGCVTTEKISDAAVTTDKIASGAVDNLQIADAAIDENKLDVGCVTTEKISDNSVTPVKCSGAPFVRSGVTVYTGDCRINVTGLFIVTLQSTRTTITFGPSIPGVVHIIARNTTTQAITVQLKGPTAVANYGSFSVPSKSQYAITVRFTTGSPNTVVEARKLDFFQTFPLLG